MGCLICIRGRGRLSKSKQTDAMGIDHKVEFRTVLKLCGRRPKRKNSCTALSSTPRRPCHSWSGRRPKKSGLSRPPAARGPAAVAAAAAVLAQDSAQQPSAPLRHFSRCPLPPRLIHTSSAVRLSRSGEGVHPTLTLTRVRQADVRWQESKVKCKEMQRPLTGSRRGREATTGSGSFVPFLISGASLKRGAFKDAHQG